ncbi:MAG: long-chain-acyl-CoA synthetase [Gammaproteobacteria bacterium]|nr:MAG: long-chain-acyl-CoA synthetase [Gammaproteobacteria bacterium]
MIATPDESVRSPLKAWVRALERTAAVGRDPSVTLPVLIERLAGRFADAPALIGSEGTLGYRELAAAANRYARWGLARGFAPGDVVCLLMKNCPQYLAIWLGLSRIGATVALINTNLTGEPLAHALGIVAPRHVIAGAELSRALAAVRSRLAAGVGCSAHGPGAHDLPRLDLEVGGLPGEPLRPAERAPPALADRALYIYTSGTTGLPKAANVSHLRLMQWSEWFAGLIDVQPHDRLYNCLPMYHSVGGVVACGAALVGGAAVVVRERFSVSRFWQDVAAERCTLFQYIGELCRYLVNAPPQAAESQHVLRLACGNGLRGEVWREFQQRFRIPQILEYYAATEGNFSLYNCEGRPGSIGRIPPFLAHRMPVEIVRFDVEAGAPLRDARGHCVRCAADEVGEAIGQILDDHGTTRFEGYADPAASRSKVLRGAFSPGDAWYRSGDLMRRDAQGFFYFVDRVGDTFRWKGENVSTTEVADVIGRCRGVTEVAVYGVPVPEADGRAGMAAIVTGAGFELAELHRKVTAELPPYARPLFLRIVAALELTGTFKQRTRELAREGYDPRTVSDELYLDDAARQEYQRLDVPLYQRLLAGQVRP